MRSYTYKPQDLLEMLLEKENITQGFWELSINFQGKGGATLEQGEQGLAAPSIVFRVVGIGLVEKPNPTPATVDASKIRRPTGIVD